MNEFLIHVGKNYPQKVLKCRMYFFRGWSPGVKTRSLWRPRDNYIAIFYQKISIFEIKNVKIFSLQSPVTRIRTETNADSQHCS
jgi:hypothetical protein